MKNREYYLNTETNNIYFIDICIGDFSECSKHIDEYFNDFDKNSMIFVFCTEPNKIIEKNRELTEQKKNHIVLYSSLSLSNMDSLVGMIDHIQTSRISYNPIASSNPIDSLIKKEEKQQEKQVIYNITKRYIREKKLKRICRISN